jgi:phage-related tail fiber protein
MTTPTITLYPDTLPAKGQANAPFDTNVDNFLSWLTATNGPELAAMITWTQGVADNVLATALAGDLPPLTGQALSFIRANAAENGGEFRTPAEVLGDIGAAPAVQGTPTGTIINVAMNTAPTGYLKANGATVSRSTYAALFAAIGTTFGVGDGSTTFELPDLRGEFVRGWDDGRGVDGSRAFGSTQADELEAHNHIGGSKTFTSLANAYGVVSTDSGNISSFASGTFARELANTSTTGGTETRPRNIALLACIKT